MFQYNPDATVISASTPLRKAECNIKSKAEKITKAINGTPTAANQNENLEINEMIS